MCFGLYSLAGLETTGGLHTLEGLVGIVLPVKLRYVQSVKDLIEKIKPIFTSRSRRRRPSWDRWPEFCRRRWSRRSGPGRWPDSSWWWHCAGRGARVRRWRWLECWPCRYKEKWITKINYIAGQLRKVFKGSCQKSHEID